MVRNRAAGVLKSLFPKSTPAEIDRLTFCFLIRVMTAMGKPAAAADGKEKRKSLNDGMISLPELNNQDFNALQSMISNWMKACTEARSGIATNLKAS